MTSLSQFLCLVCISKLRIVFRSARGSTLLSSDGQEGCEDGAKLLGEAFRSMGSGWLSR